MAGQGVFQQFSNCLQPNTWLESPSKPKENKGKARKAKALQPENGWKDPCPATLKMSSAAGVLVIAGGSAMTVALQTCSAVAAMHPRVQVRAVICYRSAQDAESNIRLISQASS